MLWQHIHEIFIYLLLILIIIIIRCFIIQILDVSLISPYHSVSAIDTIIHSCISSIKYGNYVPMYILLLIRYKKLWPKEISNISQNAMTIEYLTFNVPKLDMLIKILMHWLYFH